MGLKGWFPYGSPGSFWVVSGRFRRVRRPWTTEKTIWKLNRNDSKRPRTTDDPCRLWVVSDRIEIYPDDTKRPGDDRKRQKDYMETIGDTQNDQIRPKQAHNAFQPLSVCSSRRSIFKMVASKEKINASCSWKNVRSTSACTTSFRKTTKH